MADELLKIDITKVVTDVIGRMPRRGDTARILRGLSAAAMGHWKMQAQRKLRATARDYIAGLQQTVSGNKTTIVLLGTLPNLIEQGFMGGDMRTYMLNGPRAKTAKEGHRYLTIPFRHGTPGTGGRNVGRPMPQSIHRAAKLLAPTVSRPSESVGGPPGRTVRYGERLHPGSRGVKAAASKLLLGKEKPWHATSIYTGMVRHEKQFEKAKQTTGYQTFRVLSEKVKRGKQHWLHPGLRARRFAPETVRYVGRIAKDIIATATK